MRRLLILCEYPTLLGGERSMLATLPAVARAGFEVRVAAPGGGELEQALNSSAVLHIPITPFCEDGVKQPLSELRQTLADLLRIHKPQLVHANSLSMSRILGPVAAECGVRSIGHLRDIVKLSRLAVDDLNAHDLLIAVSEATQTFHVGQGLDSAKCVVSWNGIDLEAFQPRHATGYLHAELGLPRTVRFVATIGQIGLRKGTDVVLEAAASVCAEIADIHWLIVGERTSEKAESREFELRLQEVADFGSLAGRVHFLGYRQDVRHLLTECALLVHGAWQEPLGRVLLEAAASGLPVVATDVGGTREIFPGEPDGAVLLPIDEAAAMAEAVVQLATNEAWRCSLGVGGRRRAEQAFAIDAAAERLVKLYESVLT